MPFGTITSQTVNYAPRQPGQYVKDTLTFGDPTNEFRIRGAASPDRNGVRRSSVSRVLSKDVTTGSTTERKSATVTMAITVPDSGFTAAELDSLATDLSNFITSETVTRLLAGES